MNDNWCVRKYSSYSTSYHNHIFFNTFYIIRIGVPIYISAIRQSEYIHNYLDFGLVASKCRGGFEITFWALHEGHATRNVMMY